MGSKPLYFEYHDMGSKHLYFEYHEIIRILKQYFSVAPSKTPLQVEQDLLYLFSKFKEEWDESYGTHQ